MLAVKDLENPRFTRYEEWGFILSSKYTAGGS